MLVIGDVVYWFIIIFLNVFLLNVFHSLHVSRIIHHILLNLAITQVKFTLLVLFIGFCLLTQPSSSSFHDEHVPPCLISPPHEVKLSQIIRSMSEYSSIKTKSLFLSEVWISKVVWRLNLWAKVRKLPLLERWNLCIKWIKKLFLFLRQVNLQALRNIIRLFPLAIMNLKALSQLRESRFPPSLFLHIILLKTIEQLSMYFLRIANARESALYIRNEDLILLNHNLSLLYLACNDHFLGASPVWLLSRLSDRLLVESGDEV